MIQSPVKITLRSLFFVTTFERFSYWGLQSILVFYLLHTLHLTTSKAYAVFGAFTAFTYAFSVLGGLATDKLISFRQALVLGVILLIVGNIVLAIPNASLVFLGLALISCGTSLFTPSSSNLLGSIYETVPIGKRERAFSLLYMGGNIGGLFSPIVYGILFTHYSAYLSFILSAILLIFWFILYQVRVDAFLPAMQQHKSRPGNLKFYLILLAAILFIWLLVQAIKFAGILLSVVGVITLIWLILLTLRKQAEYAKKIFFILWLIFFSLLFFAFEFQVNSSLLIFADHYINRDIVNWKIPPSAFAALEPFFVIVLAPVVAILPYIGNNRKASYCNTLIKVAIAFVVQALGFYLFVLAVHLLANAPTNKLSMGWFIFASLLIGTGEVLLMPTVISEIARHAPASLKGTLMGVLYLGLAFSGYFAGLIASFTSIGITTSNNFALVGYKYTYNFISLLSLIVACIALISSIFIRKTTVRREKLVKV